MKIRLFGTVRIEADDTPVSPGPPAQKKVLALLALKTGHAVPVDRIIEDMWGDDPPANATQIVRTYVSRLRKVLEPLAGDDETPVIATDHGGYRLAIDADDVDVLRFQRLVHDGESTGDIRRFLEADRLWTDEPLADFPYDEIAVRLRDRLSGIRLDALEHRLALEVEPPVSSAAVDELRALVDQHPLRERLWVLLMTGLYRTGRQTEALRIYDRVREVLADVGLEPGPDLRQIEAAVVQHDDSVLSPEKVSRLPAAVDTFIGRATELEDIATRLETGRLVTLVGAGGSGKTRLALEVGRTWSAGQAFFVDLAPVRAPAGVVEALLDAIGEPQRHSTDPLLPAVRVLAADSPLLVVDNCEHLLDEVSAVVERLLVACPALTVLTTSREALRARGEALVPVPPMGLPHDSDVDAVLDSDAGRLFLERARSANPDFEIGVDNAAAVVTVLTYLDGIPLALEMAALQLQAGDVEGLARSLEDVFAGLGAGRRTVLPRHRTLRATVDWSYRLLDDAPRQLFRRLGVLPGDFDSDVVPSLGGDEEDLRRLVAASMVTRSPGGRYRLLVPLRQFAVALLDEAGDRPAAEAAVEQHFERLVSELGAGFRRFGEERWQAVFAADRVNIVAAIEAAHDASPTRSAGLAAVVLPYLVRLGLYAEALRLGDRALIEADDHTLVELHAEMAFAASHRGDLARAERHVEAALGLVAAGSDEGEAARLLNQVGSIVGQKGHVHDARDRFAEALGVYERVIPDEWHVPLVNLCWAETVAGHLDVARDLHARLEHARARNALPGEANPMADALAGMIARMEGSLVSADEVLGKAIDGFSTHRSEFHRALAQVERATVRYEMGDTDAAESLAREVVASVGTGDDSIRWRLSAETLLASIALDSGSPSDARNLLRQAYGLSIEVGNSGEVPSIAEVAAALAAGSGDVDVAGDLLGWSDRRRAELGLARDPHQTERRNAIATAGDPPGQAIDDEEADRLLEQVLAAPGDERVVQRSIGKPTIEPHSVQLPS